MKKYLLLALWIIIFEAVAAYIGLVTQHDINTWYKTLMVPPLVPPDQIFPIVWTILYVLIAAAGWNLWNTRRSMPQRLFILYAFYVGLNWSWSFVFFYEHQLLLGLIWIAVMNIIAVAFILQSRQMAPLASRLMILPTLWTLFAMYLNGGFWFLN